MLKSIEQQGTEPSGSSGRAFAAIVKSDHDRWGEVIRAARLIDLTQGFHKRYALVPDAQAQPDHEPPASRNVAAIAQRDGHSPLDVVYER